MRAQETAVTLWVNDHVGQGDAGDRTSTVAVVPRSDRDDESDRSRRRSTTRSSSGRSSSSSSSADRSASKRTVDKGRTRRELLDGALDLLEDRSLDNLGIREVTRAAGVAPAAFYRHFDAIEDLGLVLVDETFTTLRQLMRGARDDVNEADDMIRQSVTVLVRHIHDNRPHYRFLAREQYSAIDGVRLAIRRELLLFSTELATDLARLPVVNTWPTRDLVMLADLIVGLMVDTSRRIIDAIEEAPEREPEVIAETERRLRYLSYGALSWRPRP